MLQFYDTSLFACGFALVDFEGDLSDLDRDIFGEKRVCKRMLSEMSDPEFSFNIP